MLRAGLDTGSWAFSHEQQPNSACPFSPTVCRTIQSFKSTCKLSGQWNRELVDTR